MTLLVRELRTHQVELEVQNEELRRARAELEVSLGKYHHLFDFAPVGYFTLDRDGAIVEVNRAGASLLAVARPRLVGHRLASALALADRPHFNRFLAALLETGGSTRCKVEIHAGIAVRHVQLEAAAVLEGSPQQRLCRIAAIDISERVVAEAERAHLQEALHQARKLESIGRLAGGIAHDFNNMLQVILTSAEFAVRRLATGEAPSEELDDIREAARRSASLTSKLLTFAARQPVSPKVLDLNACVEPNLSMVRRLIGEDIELAWRPSMDLWLVSIDPGQVGQLLLNLATNARNAILGRGSIRIGTRNIVLDEPATAGPLEVHSRQYVELSVRDTGAGLSDAARAHLFEPFFTTQTTGKGTGLGLAIVHGIVTQNHGLVRFESERGIGTTFRLLFPRHHPPIEATLLAPAGAAHGGASMSSRSWPSALYPS